MHGRHLEERKCANHGHQGGRKLEAGLLQRVPHDLLKHKDASCANQHLFATSNTREKKTASPQSDGRQKAMSVHKTKKSSR